jgi:hypothetical protein
MDVSSANRTQQLPHNTSTPPTAHNATPPLPPATDRAEGNRANNARDNTMRGMLRAIPSNITGALTQVAGGPTPAEVSSTRQAVDEGTRDHRNEFSQAVNGVNRNFASHRNDELPAAHGEQYIHDGAAVERGEMSRATAFFNSAAAHADDGNPTGVAFNFAGAFFGGAIDAAKRSTGKD